MSNGIIMISVDFEGKYPNVEYMGYVVTHQSDDEIEAFEQVAINTGDWVTDQTSAWDEAHELGIVHDLPVFHNSSIADFEMELDPPVSDDDWESR